MRRRRLVWACLAALVLIGGAGGADDTDRPEILNVVVTSRLVAGRAGQARLTYRAPRANVVAVVQTLEDLDGSRRTSSQREIGTVAAAFGHETGDLVVPLAFETPGRKRAVFVLLTDERVESDPASVDVDVAP
ncbi:MAG TPA: hypothetical protein VHO73_06095 [Methylomirabilota bacterium]|nr:hypothetical protein [Methylomirabilota bacterium]